MPVTKLKQLLDERRVHYTSLPHSLAYTAQGIAALTHTPGKEFAKTVVVKLDGQPAMAVLPASSHVDLKLLKRGTSAKAVEIASETDFAQLFPDCELGAMPPFGILYDVPTLVDASLAEDEEIAFNAGSHQELLRMSFADYKKLVQPKVLKFSSRWTTHAA